MKISACILIVVTCVLRSSLAAPLEDNNSPEDRRLFHNKRKRPCRRDATGRTFFDWNYSYININNYFSDCGHYGYLPPAIHNPIGIHGGHHQHHHVRPPYSGGGGFFGSNNPSNGGGGGLFGLGLFDWLGGGNTRPSNTAKPESTEAPAVTESQTEDADYDNDKPVDEELDDIVLDRYHGNFNPGKIVKRVNKNIDNFFRPIFDWFT